MNPKDGITFSGSGMVEEVYDFIRAELPAGNHILELGAGYVSTQVLPRTYQLTTIEHDPQFVGMYPTNYIYAPRVGDWYDPASVEAALRRLVTPYQMIIVDGPDPRMGFWEHRHLFDLRGILIIDDIWRAEEWEMAQRFSKELNRPIEKIFQFEHGGKNVWQTAVLKPT